MSNYQIRNWYWSVHNVAGKVYSSAVNAFVSIDDQAFVEWKGDGVNVPTPIADQVDLWDVFQRGAPDLIPGWLFGGETFAQPAPGQFEKFQLSAYAGVRRRAREEGGLVFNALPISTDRQSQAMISGAYNMVQGNPEMVVSFKTDGGFVKLNAEQISALAMAVGAHVQKCFAKEEEVDAAITAGTITSPDGVDAAFAVL